MMVRLENLKKIFDSPLEKLIEYSFEYEGKTCEALYLEIIINYLQSDKSKLQKIVSKIEKETELEDHAILNSMAKLRYNLLINKYDISELEAVTKLAESYEFWKVDVYSVVAFGYGRAGNHIKAKIFFKKSYREGMKIGAEWRSLMALRNYINAERNIYPEKKLLGEFQMLINKSLTLGHPSVAGVAYRSLALEYLKNGAFNQALKEVNNSLEYLEQLRGSISFHLSISIKADILIQLGLSSQAVECINTLAMSNHPEIQETIKVLKSKISNKHIEINHSDLTIGWQERYEKLISGVKPGKLGKLEEKLLVYISRGPKSKHQVIEHLYGSEIDYYTLENRFKNLIGRFRKKAPNVIVFYNDKYQFSDSKLISDLEDAS